MSYQFKTLDEVTHLFNHWRSTRTKRGKVPAHLWRHVEPLMKQHNITTIAHALSLNTLAIKENLSLRDKSLFVEVSDEAPQPIEQAINDKTNVEQSCAIELHHSNGSILKVSAMPQHMLSELITEFTR